PSGTELPALLLQFALALLPEQVGAPARRWRLLAGARGAEPSRVEEPLDAELDLASESLERRREILVSPQHLPDLLLSAVDGAEPERDDRRGAERGLEDGLVPPHLLLEPGRRAQVLVDGAPAELLHRDRGDDRGHGPFADQ